MLRIGQTTTTWCQKHHHHHHHDDHDDRLDFYDSSPQFPCWDFNYFQFILIDSNHFICCSAVFFTIRWAGLVSKSSIQRTSTEAAEHAEHSSRLLSIFSQSKFDSWHARIRFGRGRTKRGPERSDQHFQLLLRSVCLFTCNLRLFFVRPEQRPIFEAMLEFRRLLPRFQMHCLFRCLRFPVKKRFNLKTRVLSNAFAAFKHVFPIWFHINLSFN